MSKIKPFLILLLILIVVPMTQAAVDDADTLSPLAVIIALPIVLGFFCLVGAATLSEDHNVLKIFLFLLSFLSFFSSMGLGLITVAKYFDFDEMQSAIGDTIFWTGIIFGVIVTYFIIYGMVMMFQSIAKKKEEELQY